MMSLEEYKELAELLFPNVKNTVDYYLKKYPKRNIKQGAEVLRIAPSPTGYLHLGNFYSAFIQYIATKQTNGVFYMRLEDTDQKREKKDAGEIAYQGLLNFGVTPDEGYRGDSLDEIGNYGPYIQSNRTEIYKAFAKNLVSTGNAFPCFCEKTESKEEILERREKQLSELDEIIEKDACRDLSFIQIKENLNNGKSFAIRLKSKGDGTKVRKIVDVFKGEREIKENAKDIILLKSNGIPPYALAHLADDILMRTTKVIRGEDWYPSMPAHIELFELAGFKPAVYGHNPLICTIDAVTGNKRKLSKRYDAYADMRYFLEAGYPVQAVLEYLLTIANSDFELWRMANPDKSFWDFPFSLEKVGSNHPMFDLNKLDYISKNIIAKKTCSQINSEVENYFNGFGKKLSEKVDLKKVYKVLAIDRETEKPRKDIAKYSDIPLLYEYLFNAPRNGEFINDITNQYAKFYKHEDTKEKWFERVKEICTATGQSVRDYTKAIRLAITGRENSPDLYAIMQILGAQEVIKRLTQK